MSVKFASNINLHGNQILEMLLENLAMHPINPVEARTYWNTTDKTPYIFDGTEWKSLVGGQELTIATDSQGFLTIANGELSISNIAITNVKVDTTYNTLAEFIAVEYVAGNEFQQGDTIILTNATNPQERSYIHNGGIAGDINDFTRLQTDVMPSTVRAMFSATSGLVYNETTGEFATDLDTSLELVGNKIAVAYDVVGDMLAGAGLKYDPATNKLISDKEFYTLIGDGSTVAHTIALPTELQNSLYEVQVTEISSGEPVMCSIVKGETTTNVTIYPPAPTDAVRVLFTKNIATQF